MTIRKKKKKKIERRRDQRVINNMIYSALTPST